MHYDVALILLYDSDGKVLLQHRTEDAATLPGYWAFFGGRVNEGEAPEEAVRREAKEELDYLPRSPELILEHAFSEGDASGNLYVFAERFAGDMSVLRLQEGQGWGWFDAGGIKPLRMVARDRGILEALWKYAGSREAV